MGQNNQGGGNGLKINSYNKNAHAIKNHGALVL